MIYPSFIKKGDTIGVTALSDGIVKEEKLYRLNSAILNWENRGFLIKETCDVRKSVDGCSDVAKVRAFEFHDLLEDNGVKAIICAAGGDFLLEVLPYIDFSLIRKIPKWIQGYSDPTGLLFVFTTNLDIATIYGDNFGSFGMKVWHSSLDNNLEILSGNVIEQLSFDKYEDGYIDYVVGDEIYSLTEKVYWKNLWKEDNVEINGRIIGGCLDVLNDLFGTRFDKTKDFIDRYKNDGIIWYFDICEMSFEQLIRTFWKLKDNGWFSYTNGILIGRTYSSFSYYDFSLADVLKYSFKDLNIPVIYDVDIGHVAPRMTIINGAKAYVVSSNGKGRINFELN